MGKSRMWLSVFDASLAGAALGMAQEGAPGRGDSAENAADVIGSAMMLADAADAAVNAREASVRKSAHAQAFAVEIGTKLSTAGVVVGILPASIAGPAAPLDEILFLSGRRVRRSDVECMFRVSAESPSEGSAWTVEEPCVWRWLAANAAWILEHGQIENGDADRELINHLREILAADKVDPARLSLCGGSIASMVRWVQREPKTSEAHRAAIVDLRDRMAKTPYRPGWVALDFRTVNETMIKRTGALPRGFLHTIRAQAKTAGIQLTGTMADVGLESSHVGIKVTAYSQAGLAWVQDFQASALHEEASAEFDVGPVLVRKLMLQAGVPQMFDKRIYADGDDDKGSGVRGMDPFDQRFVRMVRSLVEQHKADLALLDTVTLAIDSSKVSYMIDDEGLTTGADVDFQTGRSGHESSTTTITGLSVAGRAWVSALRAQQAPTA